MTLKRCPQCQQEKPRRDFSRNRAMGDGLNSQCRPCRAANFSRRTATGQDGLRLFRARSGLAPSAARLLWEAIRRPSTICSICGIPGHRLAAYERRNAPCPSFHRNHRKMEPDRIIPGSMGGQYLLTNVRPLCPRCNFLRGPARRSDQDVRVIMWAAWQKFEDINHLGWFSHLHILNGVYTLRADAEGTACL